MTDEAAHILHATAVAVAGQAVLIKGGSGRGKSSLALEMMARGATLVSDDRVVLTVEDGELHASPPPTLRGMIEARGVGILHAEHEPVAQVVVVVDLDTLEEERIPPNREITILGVSRPLLHNVASQHFPAALIQYLKQT